MDSIAEYLEQTVRGLGSVAAGFGLFIVAFFDSSLLSLPEINDVLLIYCGTQFSDKAYYYAFMTVLGSALGASLLYWLARWKGYSFLKNKFSDGKIDWVFKLFHRYGALAVAVPAILPPPFPFKIFVLSSGVLGLPYSRFLVAILLGRSFRYFGEAFLARPLRRGRNHLLTRERDRRSRGHAARVRRRASRLCPYPTPPPHRAQADGRCPTADGE